MANLNKRSTMTSAAVIAILVLLLLFGGIWCWLSSGAAEVTAGESPRGPMAKISDWVEPPPAEILVHDTEQRLYLLHVMLSEIADGTSNGPAVTSSVPDPIVESKGN